MGQVSVYKKQVILKENTVFYNIKNQYFTISGLMEENGFYRRIPEKVAETVNSGVLEMHSHVSGGRVRFKTDSSFIAIRAEMGKINLDSNATVSANAGFDLYIRHDDKNT